MKNFHKVVLLPVALCLVSVTNLSHAGAQQGASDGCNGPADVLIGRDDDNVFNPLIQSIVPPPNQSLDNADVLQGGGGCDVIVGLFGNDVLRGGPGSDILIGGTEQFDPEGFGSKDVMFGDGGNDVSIWAPGDGSDFFIGGPGARDAQVFGVLDRDAANVPVLTPIKGRFAETGVPTADVTGSPGFCTLERVADESLGFDFLVRFFVRATGGLAVTVRLTDVEQVFCTSKAGGAITYADLRQDNPQFVQIHLAEVKKLNRVVADVIR